MPFLFLHLGRRNNVDFSIDNSITIKVTEQVFELRGRIELIFHVVILAYNHHSKPIIWHTKAIISIEWKYATTSATKQFFPHANGIATRNKKERELIIISARLLTINDKLVWNMCLELSGSFIYNQRVIKTVRKWETIVIIDHHRLLKIFSLMWW